MRKQWTEELIGPEARAALRRGIDRVYRPVAATIGAKGRNSVFVEFGHGKPTNDGVSIARRIFPKDPYERIGADLIKEAAEATVEEAGDGTSVTTILSHTLADLGEVKITAGKDPMELRAELQAARDYVLQKIKDAKIDVKDREDILNVAKVSVEDDEMAEIVTDAVVKAGKYGVVLVQEGSGYAIEKEEVKGYYWDRGYISPYMITNAEDNTAILEDVPIIVTDRYMNLNRDLLTGVLNELLVAKHTKAIIVVDRMEGELLQSLIMNKLKSVFTAIVVQRPGSLEELEDIAAVTGATAITKDKGIKVITAGHCGFVKRVVVEEKKTTLITDESSSIEERIKNIDEAIEKAKKAGQDIDLLVMRRAKLTDGIVMIRVGARTDAERKYKKDKLDDAVCAAKAATEEGIVQGGGYTLLKIANEMEANTDGDKVMIDALKKPYAQILENGGIKKPDFLSAYNVKTGKKVKDMIKEGIIDPAKVLRCAIENSVSFAGNFLTLESVIADFEETDHQSA